MSKELTICLNEDKIYFPGDIIKGMDASIESFCFPQLTNA